MKPQITTVGILLALLMANLSLAEVKEAEAGGFTINHSVVIAASPRDTWQALTGKIGQWWNSDHTYSGDAGNLYIEAKAGGCFCESWPEGSVEHMRIVYAHKDKALRMSGGLGPLQPLGVQGSMDWVLTAEQGGTRLELTYRVGGYLKQGLDSWSQPVDKVLQQQVAGLKAYIEKE